MHRTRTFWTRFHVPTSKHRPGLVGTALALLLSTVIGGCGDSGKAAGIRPGETLETGPGAGVSGFFRQAGADSAYARFLANKESSRDWTLEEVRRRYPIGYQPDPGYKARQVEFAQKVEDTLVKWAPKGWDSKAFFARVRKDGMAVAPVLQYPNYFQALDAIFHSDLPLVFTTDAFLQTVYLSYDKMMIDLENTLFIPSLTRILDSSLAYSKARYGNQNHEQDVRDVLMTARLLLVPKPFKPEDRDDAYYFRPSKVDVGPVPERVGAWVADAQAQAMKTISLFGRDTSVDFTQFKPRGHYTKSPELVAYFQAMMWLSRADLAFDLGPMKGDAPARTRMKKVALVLWDCVVGSKSYPAWEELDRSLNFMVGPADGMALEGMGTLAGALRIKDMQAYLEKFDEQGFDRALAATGLGAQAILSQAAADSPGRTPPALAPIFSFLPQRFVLDSYSFGQLVHQNVEGKAMPSPLEIAFALGDNSALDDLPAAGFAGYPGALASQRALYDDLPAPVWQGSLYNGWLDFLRRLNGAEANPRAAPAFRTRAWRMKMRNTQLASWAQLRHNTILYAKQSYTYSAICEFPRVYVEPYPKFFEAVEAYARQGARMFNDGKRIRIPGYFKSLEEISGKLRQVAERTARGESPTDSQTVWLKDALKVGSSGGCAPSWFYRGWYMELNYEYSWSYPAKQRDYTIADVHTKPVSDDLGPAQVLHVATGPVQLMVMAVKLDTCVSLFVGPVAAYYEVNRAGDSPVRMNDAEWLKALDDKADFVKRPPWAGAFLAP